MGMMKRVDDLANELIAFADGDVLAALEYVDTLKQVYPYLSDSYVIHVRKYLQARAMVDGYVS